MQTTIQVRPCQRQIHRTIHGALLHIGGKTGEDVDIGTSTEKLSGRNIHLTFLCDSHISCRYRISGQKNRRELQDTAAIS